MIDFAFLQSVEVAFYLSTVVLAICCLFYYYCTKKPQKARNYLFVIMLVDVLLSAVAEAAFYILGYVQGDTNTILSAKYICEYIYFALHLLLPAFYTLYIMFSNGRAISRKFLFYVLYFIPAIVAEVIVFLNPVKKWVITLYPDGSFERGDMAMIIYGIAAFYMVLVLTQIFAFSRTLTKAVYRALWFFYLIAISGVAIQFVRPDITVELFGECLSLLGVMMIIENEDSLTDVITRVYNQRAFVVDNDRYLATKHKYTVVTVSFTNMRFFNRMLRVVTVDKLWHSIAMWLSSVAGKATVYRIGTSCFALVSFENEAKVEQMVKKIENKFNGEYLFNGMHFSFNVLMTISHIPDEFQRVEAILELAEMPNPAETKGVTVLKGNDLAFIRHKAEVEEMIKRALDRDRIEVYYQPIWSSEKNKILWCEALVRLNDTELGIITPENFVEIAEQTGQIIEVGKVVFDKVCQFLHRERPERFGMEYVEVNLSSYQLLVDETAFYFDRAMKKHGIKPDQINLEITESASFHESEALARNIQRLRDRGFKFSLDDFGTGYSNLTYVINTEFENIKSDKGLLWDVDNIKSRIVLLETIKMMRTLGMDVVQEGVETKDQLDLVVGAGANKIQGYYFSKPLPAAEFIDYLEEYNGAEEEK